MSKICAFDLSLLNTGYAIAIDGKVTSFGLIEGKGDGVERLIFNRDAVCDLIDNTAPDLIVFEDFSYGSSDGKAFERAGMAYMIRAELFGDKRPYFAVSPMSLKKFVVGSAGSAKKKVTKDLVIKEIFRRFGHNVDDNNVADAIGLAYVAMAALGDWDTQMDPQRQVLATVYKNYPWIKTIAWPVPENPCAELELAEEVTDPTLAHEGLNGWDA